MSGRDLAARRDRAELRILMFTIRRLLLLSDRLQARGDWLTASRFECGTCGAEFRDVDRQTAGNIVLLHIRHQHPEVIPA